MSDSIAVTLGSITSSLPSNTPSAACALLFSCVIWLCKLFTAVVTEETAWLNPDCKADSAAIALDCSELIEDSRPLTSESISDFV